MEASGEASVEVGVGIGVGAGVGARVEAGVGASVAMFMKIVTPNDREEGRAEERTHDHLQAGRGGGGAIVGYGDVDEAD